MSRPRHQPIRIERNQRGSSGTFGHRLFLPMVRIQRARRCGLSIFTCFFSFLALSHRQISTTGTLRCFPSSADAQSAVSVATDPLHAFIACKICVRSRRNMCPHLQTRVVLYVFAEPTAITAWDCRASAFCCTAPTSRQPGRRCIR